MLSSIFLIHCYNFAISLCIFRSIKLPSVQQDVSHTKPVQTLYTRGKSTRGRGSIARGHARSSATQGTLKEIKEAVTKNKDETLSSNTETLDEDEEKEDKTEGGENKDKENVQQSRKNQTARQGRSFARGGRVRKKIQIV